MLTTLAEELHGRYRIEALLGEGGMGAVYKAHDWLKKREAAVKCLLQKQTCKCGRDAGAA